MTRQAANSVMEEETIDHMPALRKQAYGYEELVRCGRGELFGMDNGRLPMPGMLMFDRIISVSDKNGMFGRGEIVAELDIKPDLWFFTCHFKDDPIMPGCLGLDALWQLLGFFLIWSGHKGRGRALGVKGVKFCQEVLPGDTKVSYHVHVRRTLKQGMTVAVADGYVMAGRKIICEADGLRVGIINPTQSLRSVAGRRKIVDSGKR